MERDNCKNWTNLAQKKADDWAIVEISSYIYAGTCLIGIRIIDFSIKTVSDEIKWLRFTNWTNNSEAHK
jgi:hypothetical protein